MRLASPTSDARRVAPGAHRTEGDGDSDPLTLEIPFDLRTGVVGTPRVIAASAQPGRHRARSVEQIKRDNVLNGIISQFDDLPVLGEVAHVLRIGRQIDPAGRMSCLAVDRRLHTGEPRGVGTG